MRILKQFPFLVLFALGVIWGTNFLFMKIVVSVISPLQVVWLRVLSGGLPIFVYALVMKVLSWKDCRRAHHFGAMALLANVLPYYFYVKGTQLLASGIAGVISGTTPLMTALLVVLILPAEKLNLQKGFGIFIGLIGVLLVADLKSAFSFGKSGELVGVCFMLMGSISYAFAILYAKKVVAPLKMSSLQLASYQALFASLLLIPVTPTQGMGAILENSKALLALVLGLGLTGTGLAFVMYYFIIDKLGAITASSVYYIPPVIALLFGALFRSETVTFLQILGTIIIITGIYFARDEGKHAVKT
ncbi:MAG: DMT family transporter [Candidatus Wallbacteria bacterium]|nr:DMT family transporter [Candidatus Wallbacteria bacterium]